MIEVKCISRPTKPNSGTLEIGYGYDSQLDVDVDNEPVSISVKDGADEVGVSFSWDEKGWGIDVDTTSSGEVSCEIDISREHGVPFVRLGSDISDGEYSLTTSGGKVVGVTFFAGQA